MLDALLVSVQHVGHSNPLARPPPRPRPLSASSTAPPLRCSPRTARPLGSPPELVQPVQHATYPTFLPRIRLEVFGHPFADLPFAVHATVDVDFGGGGVWMKITMLLRRC